MACVLVNGLPEWEVDKVIDSRINACNKREYRVLWRDWPAETASWEVAENLENAPLKVKEYWASAPFSDSAKGGRGGTSCEGDCGESCGRRDEEPSPGTPSRCDFSTQEKKASPFGAEAGNGFVLKLEP
ncbi:hypothetical protein SELMODRAFT_422706 [Selaginella moellendorffii]|uniref:Chromo domain-containing protein n=1 Tax=Selaginella moellendorffii TaxID=88036 RepID=D8SJA2_SELML|nr:hypothetical protein SELMODRAFT_422706 [Selaginella moellendorffii]